MHQEPRCEFELVAWELAPAELGSGLWIGPTLPRCVGGVAPFHPHLSLLLPLGVGWALWGGGVGALMTRWWGWCRPFQPCWSWGVGAGGGGVFWGGGGGGEGCGGACPWLGEGQGMLEG